MLKLSRWLVCFSFLLCSTQTHAAETLDKIVVQLPWHHQFQFAGYYAALEQGYYQDAGFDVLLESGNPERIPVAEVLSGRAQYGVARSELLLHRLKGKPVVAIAAVFQHSAVILLARDDSGINSPQDMIGRRIMLLEGDNAAEYKALFQRAGISLDQINVMPSSYNVNDLIQGNTDVFNAYSTNEPFFMEEQRIPYSIIRPSDYGIQFYGDTLFTSENELATNPERVKAFRAASIRGWQYALSHHEEVIELLINKYKVTKNKSHLRYEANAIAELILPEIVEIGHMLPERWEHMANIFVDLGMADAGYSLDGFIYDPNPERDLKRVYLMFGVTFVVLALLGSIAIALFIFNRRMANEIMERKLVEKSLKKAALEWSTAMDASEDIIYLLDPDRHLLQANKFFYLMTGGNPQSAIGQHIERIIHPEGEVVPCPVCVAQNEKRDEVIIMNADHPHNPLGKPLEVTIKVVRDDGGQPISILMRLHDLSDQKRIEEELFQAHKMEAIGTLAGGIAHDFNNILAAIIGYSEIIKESIPADSSAREDIEKVLKASKRAADLVKQILTFGRKSDQKMEPLSLHLICKEALKMMRASLPTTIEIQENIDNDCGKVMADATNIHQIIVNLCTNALHSMEDEKGVLSVSLFRKEISDADLTGAPNVSAGPFIVLKVSDTGHGMDQKTIERIFDPFYTTKEVGKGTGLGLAVTYGIVQDHHGFIRVKSQPGQGTIFYVHIPVLEQEASSFNEIEKDETLPGGSEQILIVDDETMIANMNTAILERLGYRVTALTDSRDALEKIRSDPGQFDLIITDQTMPHLTGAELAQEILQLKQNMPIILCTGYSSVLSEEGALAIGIKKYLIKPVDRATLAKMVRQVIDEN